MMVRRSAMQYCWYRSDMTFAQHAWYMIVEGSEGKMTLMRSEACVYMLRIIFTKRILCETVGVVLSIGPLRSFNQQKQS